MSRSPLIPRLSYIICSDRRTGSTLLCEALRKTNIAGYPGEYFNPYPNIRRYWKDLLDTEADREYIQKVIEVSTTPNGVFGTKIHSFEVPELVSKIEAEGVISLSSPALMFSRRFPNLHYIWLRRENTVRQAISLYRARTTRVWSKFREPSISLKRPGAAKPEKDYDFNEIRKYLSEIEKDVLFWKTFFKQNHLVPLELTYESLSTEYESTFHHILEYMELPSNIPIPPIETIRQADEATDLWERKFLIEQGSLCYS